MNKYVKPTVALYYIDVATLMTGSGITVTAPDVDFEQKGAVLPTTSSGVWEYYDRNKDNSSLIIFPDE